jgi:hypothetical protein
LGETQPTGGSFLEEKFREESRYLKLVLDGERRLRGAVAIGFPELMEKLELLFHEGTTVPKAFLGRF